MLVGYTRVSTQNQNLHLQRYVLKKARWERTYKHKESGIRSELKNLFTRL